MKIKKSISIFLSGILLCSFFSFALAAQERCVAIYADSHTDGRGMHSKVVDAILEEKPEIVFLAGDLVDDGDDQQQWDVFNGITERLRSLAEFYPALGNHEKESPIFFSNFELPGNEMWYAVNYMGIHFIVLDTNQDIKKGSWQYRWLEYDLRDLPASTKFVIAVFHHPPFNSSYRIQDQKRLRKNIVPLFEKYKVDAVFSGHAHCYERSFRNNIYYIVTSGGSAKLYNKVRNNPYSQVYIKTNHFCKLYLDGNTLIVDVLDVDRGLIDQFKIKSKRIKDAGKN